MSGSPSLRNRINATVRDMPRSDQDAVIAAMNELTLTQS